MSAIIDISLATVPLAAYTDKSKALSDYIDSLVECGVDFFEISASVLPLLEGKDLSKRFILRISTLADLEICRKIKFAYVSMSINLSCFYEEISTHNRIIAEVRADRYSAPAVLLYASSEKNLPYISMIRVVGCSVTSDGKSTTELVNWFRKRCMTPIDICPLNCHMTGFICAAAAVKAGADAITLSYGCDYRYSSLEDYFINTSILRRSFMPKEILTGICKASGAFLELFEKAPCGIEKMGELEKRIESPVFDIARGMRYFPYRAAKHGVNRPAEAVKKKVKDLGYDEQTEEYILELLRMARLMS